MFFEGININRILPRIPPDKPPVDKHKERWILNKPNLNRKLKIALSLQLLLVDVYLKKYRNKQEAYIV